MSSISSPFFWEVYPDFPSENHILHYFQPIGFAENFTPNAMDGS